MLQLCGLFVHRENGIQWSSRLLVEELSRKYRCGARLRRHPEVSTHRWRSKGTKPMKKLALLAAASAEFSFAQLPQSRVLTLEMAQSIAQETMARCHADGYKVTVLVVDALNAPKVLMRDDGAAASTTEVAKMK